MIDHAINEICVIGGGPAGLAAAIALKQVGYTVTVVDHAFPPIDKACGEGLMPDSIVALARLGVAIPAGAGFLFRGIRFQGANSSVRSDFPRGTGIGVRRVILHELLTARARQLGVECIWGAKRIQISGPGVVADGVPVASQFIVGADGQNSLTRRQSGLDAVIRLRRRYAFRRHYRMTPWSSDVELYWGNKCQLYITPVAPDEVCIVSIANRPELRLDEALMQFPSLQSRLAKAAPCARDMGALSVSRKLRRVSTSEVALVGDASGSVDAITGEGLCLSFKQALSLADALRSGTLSAYAAQHARASRRPHFMGTLMLTLDSHPEFQRRALASLERNPNVFAALIRGHVGEQPLGRLLSWRLLPLCGSFLSA